MLQNIWDLCPSNAPLHLTIQVECYDVPPDPRPSSKLKRRAGPETRPSKLVRRQNRIDNNPSPYGLIEALRGKAEKPAA
jgi:hypothetical protein